jgi:hypothetical protein
MVSLCQCEPGLPERGPERRHLQAPRRLSRGGAQAGAAQSHKQPRASPPGPLDPRHLASGARPGGRPGVVGRGQDHRSVPAPEREPELPLLGAVAPADGAVHPPRDQVPPHHQPPPCDEQPAAARRGHEGVGAGLRSGSDARRPAVECSADGPRTAAPRRPAVARPPTAPAAWPTAGRPQP